MKSIDDNIIKEAEEFARNLFKKNLPKHFYYHDLKHTKQVVDFVRMIGKNTSSSEDEIKIVVIAAWFHDIGCVESCEGHEDVSKRMASEFLSERDIEKDIIDQVLNCIEATKIPQNPTNKLGEILCDADMAHLSQKNFLKRTKLLRKEWNKTLNKKIGVKTHFKETLQFFENHNYYTEYAQNEFTEKKKQNLLSLKAHLEKNKSGNMDELEKLKKENEKLNKKLKDSKIPTRGIESMFRLTARNQINLSAIADNKANILITVNSIILTVMTAVMFRKLIDAPNLIIPTIIFLGFCLVTIVFAILATRPKISSGTFSKEDIHNRKVNLLFFGNFYNMELDEYEWAIKEMMGDYEYLYGNMIKDQYFLGIVLARKYKLLRVAYTIFMFGMVISTLAFTIAILAFPV